MSKQGVAQRVMTELHSGRGDVLEAGWIAGARYLHDELSDETRRVLAETVKIRDSLTDEHMGTDYYGINCAVQGMQSLAKRLGLDLNEPEDSDE